jgi:hypothetical protein
MRINSLVTCSCGSRPSRENVLGVWNMAEKEITVWGIHAGKTGAADSLFLKKNFIAIGWRKMGDLSKLHAEREAFKAKVAESYP